MKTATIFYVEHVPGDLGFFDKVWFATRAQAVAAVQNMIDKQGYWLTDEPEGRYHEVMHPVSVTVPLTLEGVLGFAQHHACLDA